MRRSRYIATRIAVLLALWTGMGGIQPPALMAQESTTKPQKAETNREAGLTSVKTDTLELDSVTLTQMADSLIRKALAPPQSDHFQPDPIRSMWLALVFPGGGQIYNRKYWKLPIVYGGFLGCTYALTWNNMMLHDYQQAYLDIMDSDPSTQSYMKMLPIGYNMEGKEERFKTIFKNKKNHFRRFRDLSIFAFAGVYLISVIDAYVDAELSSFDISEDLSLHLGPAVIETGMNGRRHHQNAYGLGCTLTF